MADPFVAEIRMFSGNFAPRGWALCNGQLLPIAQNTALFSLLGTTYGGDGKSTFGLPNLQSRIPLGAGNGPGLTPRVLGEMGGEAQVTLAANELAAHSHPVDAIGTASSGTPSASAIYAQSSAGNIYGLPTHPVAMAANAVGASGGSQPHNNLQPYLVVNFIIALQGIFPPRT